jgi:hypothetical protein
VTPEATEGQLLIDEPAAGVVRLTIANPGKRGALDQAILDRFATLMPTLDARCVLITGQEASSPRATTSVTCTTMFSPTKRRS